MKKILKTVPLIIILIILVSAGIYTIFGLFVEEEITRIIISMTPIIGFILFIFIRQMYWFIFKKSDYRLNTLEFKKGNHYPKHKWSYFRPVIMTGKSKMYLWKVRFSKDSIYHLEGNDWHDINKLMGFSLCLNHHKDSIRIGWRYLPTENKIELLLYKYEDGIRYSNSLKKLSIGYEEIIRFSFNGNNLIITIGNTASIINIKKTKFLGYMIIPYFGGNKKAPGDISIEYERKDC